MVNNRLTLVNVVNETALYRETRMPALSLAYLSAYVPGNWDVRIVDETVEKFDAFQHLGDGTDIIGISGGNVCNVPRITKILDNIELYQGVTGENKTVVLGGYVGRLNLDGLPGRVDSVVAGPGESVLPILLNDFLNGGLKPTYQGTRTPMDMLKSPDFSRFNIPLYGKNINWPVQTSVSCNNKCSFCSARSVYGDGYSERSVDKVLEDMSQIPDGSRVYFTDPNLVDFSPEGLKRAMNFFKGITPRGFSWFGSVSFKVAGKTDLLKAMQDSGCRGLLIGYDSTTRKSLEKVSNAKVPEGDNNLSDLYILGTKNIQERFNIPILGTFVIGFDTDDKSVFENTTRVTRESKMNDAQYLMFTPLPGTGMYDKLQDSGRIFDEDYEHYDFTDVVFQPNNFSPRELRNGVVQMYEDTYPRMLKLYRRLGVIRDRPDEIKVVSMKERAKREAEERMRRERDDHH